jgi:3-hydroxyisobutyrate dehydrogenase-like beta-hydroxyacid dehydrogenase
MNTVAVIGVGNLGFRHLESLYKSDMPLSLFAVDPSEAARERARSLAGGSSKGVTAVASIAELPASLDLVIIATGADVRLGESAHSRAGESPVSAARGFRHV